MYAKAGSLYSAICSPSQAMHFHTIQDILRLGTDHSRSRELSIGYIDWQARLPTSVRCEEALSHRLHRHFHEFSLEITVPSIFT